MQRKGLILSIFVLPLLILGLVSCENEKEEYILNPNPIGQEITFRYASTGGADVYDSCYYTDEYFYRPASELNFSLATASYALAQASFPTTDEKNRNYANKYKNSQSFAEALGFSQYYANDNFKTKPQQNTIGLAFANKKIDVYGINTTLIMIGIRGSSYGMEWSGNFYMGEEGMHTGFTIARNTLIETLNNYIVDNDINGRIKIWIAGYSRAAAVTNLTAGALDEAKINGNNILPNYVYYTKDDIYAYCFEPPQGASIKSPYNLQGPLFNNIYCFINYQDVVPLVAPFEYGFQRYGRQLYFPTSLTTTDYQKMENIMLYFYNKSSSRRPTGPYSVNRFQANIFDFGSQDNLLKEDKNKINWPLGLYMRDFIHALAEYGIMDRQNYVANYQEGIMDAFRLLYEKTSEDSQVFFKVLINVALELSNYRLSSILIDDFFNDREMLATDLVPFFIRASEKYGIKATGEEIGQVISQFAKAFSKMFDNNLEDLTSLLSFVNIDSIANAHYPEINLAWLKSFDPNYLLQPLDYNLMSSFHKMEFDVDFTLKVFDSTNKVVAEFIEGIPQNIDTSFVYGRQNNKMVIYFPADESYSLLMSCQKEENIIVTGQREQFSINDGQLKNIYYFQQTLSPHENILININPNN